jgi:alkanesulfonate monooxygenase SsuD/methylene tetrahydromethanopterin reductase-like flavin-dependent oxidoreductase (luciferase family)
MGIGSAWHREEFDAYGFDFETTAARGARLSEAAQVIRAMLSQKQTSFAGRYYRIEEAVNEPRPVQQPHPPLMIGGNGEKVTLRVVAESGDMCNVFGTPDEVRHRLGVLREHCRAVGRPEEEITRSNFGWLLVGRTAAEVAAKREKYMQREPFAGIAGTPAQIVDRLREYAAAGSQYFLFSMPDAHEIEPVRLLGQEVLPALAGV